MYAPKKRPEAQRGCRTCAQDGDEAGGAQPSHRSRRPCVCVRIGRKRKEENETAKEMEKPPRCWTGTWRSSVGGNAAISTGIHLFSAMFLLLMLAVIPCCEVRTPRHTKQNILHRMTFVKRHSQSSLFGFSHNHDSTLRDITAESVSNDVYVTVSQHKYTRFRGKNEKC